jgi:RNA polymerase sigma-70 factor (ECF subfamily)
MTTSTVASVIELELVARAQTGDPYAMQDLIRDLHPMISKFCRYRLGSYPGGEDAAQDAVQETCLAVSAVLSSYRDHGLPFRAWVYAIASNKVADSQRRFHRAALLVDDLPEQVEPSATPEEHVMASVELQAVLALADQLPSTMRAVLLRRAAGATSKIVAAELGMSTGAVDVAHHRAVLRVRELADSTTESREMFAAFRTARRAVANKAA